MLLVLACMCVFDLFVGVCIIYFVFWHITKSLKRAGSLPACCSFHWVLGIVSGTAVICDKMLP